MVMNKGEIVFRGTPEDLQEEPDVIEKYLEI
jgi:ABC-type branched-subunit amino acid transport system ATPase component